MLSPLGTFRLGLALLAGSVVAFAQLPPPPPPPPKAQPSLEFPAALQSKVVAGSTAVGTEVRAKLTLATLVAGVVIPEEAIISGRVEQSVARTKDAPSLLKIKFDSAHWKKGSLPLDLYLVSCYYPLEFNTAAADNPPGVHGDIGITMGSAPAPGSLPRSNGGLPSNGTPSMDASHQDNFPDPRGNVSLSEVAKHWVRMEKVETAPSPDGGLQMTSTDRNIKLDKNTIYLLRNSPTMPAKP
jgi:hypothetical protein